jgi:hypothetical protein
MTRICEADSSDFAFLLLEGRAGKTTILQKICNTIKKPQVYDANGKKVCLAQCRRSIMIPPDSRLKGQSYTHRADVGSMTSKMSWCSVAIQASFFMTLEASKLEEQMNWTRFRLLSANVHNIGHWRHVFMQFGKRQSLPWSQYRH